MTEAELAHIESVLKLTLPRDYRGFVAHYPQWLTDAVWDLGWTRESVADRHFYNSPQKVIETNLDVRLPGTPWVGEDDPWPERFLAIGDDQCGNYWCVDIETPDAGVWFYNHELGEFERQHPSLQAYGESLLRDIEEFERQRNP